jgi:hypothetical protein
MTAVAATKSQFGSPELIWRRNEGNGLETILPGEARGSLRLALGRVRAWLEAEDCRISDVTPAELLGNWLSFGEHKVSRPVSFDELQCCINPVSRATGHHNSIHASGHPSFGKNEQMNSDYAEYDEYHCARRYRPPPYLS